MCVCVCVRDSVHAQHASIAIYNLAQFPERDTLQNTPIFHVGVLVGAGNIFQWSILAAAPVVQVSSLVVLMSQNSNTLLILHDKTLKLGFRFSKSK